ncbi:MAG: ATP-binding cassette domain-containing protein [Tissierellia bacterium]|nr:ATP-binding cassette domain-containing protein [Tissierellia bacterium]
MIEIKGLNKLFQSGTEDIVAVKDVNLHISKGDIFGIIGFSGAGKSTLLRCINRLEEPDSGDIIIDGINMLNLNKSDLKEQRKHIGMIFQHFHLMNQKTVYDNIAFPLALDNWKKSDIEFRVHELLDYIGLTNRADSYPSELSGGQKQRVAIARAIANSPKVLLCDEATSALDPSTTENILDLIRDIRDKFNITVVMITHQMEVLRQVCDNVAIMDAGKIIETGDVVSIFKNPQTMISKKFIGTLGTPEGKSEIINPSEFSGKILRLTFLQHTHNKPIVSQLIKKFGLDVNIISGNINQLQKEKVGNLLIEIDCDNNTLEEIITFLHDSQVHTEVII